VGGEEGMDTLIKRKGYKAAVKHNLTAAVEDAQKWATPTTMDTLPPKSEEALLREATEVRPGRSKPGNLRDQVSNMKNWPTPRAREWKDSGDPVKLAKLIDDGHEATLGRVVAKSEVEKAEHAVSEGNNNGQLNPTWVEWLMGWPIGWTSMEPITELDWRDWDTDPADEGEVPRVATGIKHRVGRLKAIGNGQVPQVAAMAWTILNN